MGRGAGGGQGNKKLKNENIELKKSILLLGGRIEGLRMALQIKRGK